MVPVITSVISMKALLLVSLISAALSVGYMTNAHKCVWYVIMGINRKL